jgi:hypothetical protein
MTNLLKLKATILVVGVAIVMFLGAPAASAKPFTFTLSFTGASWNDGGSLDGYFTVTYDPTKGAGAPTALDSMYVQTGNGTNGDGFPGQLYIYDVPGYANTVSTNDFDASQALGAPASEVYVADTAGNNLYLDWSVATPASLPTGLWVGSSGGQYSSESIGVFRDPIRGLNSQGGSGGSGGNQPSIPSGVPEPGTFSLAGLALAGTVICGLRKSRAN